MLSDRWTGRLWHGGVWAWLAVVVAVNVSVAVMAGRPDLIRTDYYDAALDWPGQAARAESWRAAGLRIGATPEELRLEGPLAELGLQPLGVRFWRSDTAAWDLDVDLVTGDVAGDVAWVAASMPTRPGNWHYAVRLTSAEGEASLTGRLWIGP